MRLILTSIVQSCNVGLLQRCTVDSYLVQGTRIVISEYIPADYYVVRVVSVPWNEFTRRAIVRCIHTVRRENHICSPTNAHYRMMPCSIINPMRTAAFPNPSPCILQSRPKVAKIVGSFDSNFPSGIGGVYLVIRLSDQYRISRAEIVRCLEP